MIVVRLFALTAVFLLAFAGNSTAEIATKDVVYQHGSVTLEGYLAYDDAQTGPRPGVLIVHQWKGLGDYEKMRAEMLADMGYVAFAVDMYGHGIRPTTSEQASEQATIYRSDRQLMRDRVTAGLDELRKVDLVDTSSIAAIGYCFGGGVVLELARSGADIEGVVSFHGNLDTPDPSDANNIQCQVLVCHGAVDPYVPMEQVQAFWNEMSTANVDWQLVAYGGAVHSFTHEDAGTDTSSGSAYDADADWRSWRDMQQFFQEVLE
ncbi:dienelactone hydrolase family protein [candidate division GN15 bacterium]|nr:dienelactone hydrolase family protein [candidate division GN15 bacterium]